MSDEPVQGEVINGATGAVIAEPPADEGTIVSCPIVVDASARGHKGQRYRKCEYAVTYLPGSWKEMRANGSLVAHKRSAEAEEAMRAHLATHWLADIEATMTVRPGD